MPQELQRGASYRVAFRADGLRCELTHRSGGAGQSSRPESLAMSSRVVQQGVADATTASSSVALTSGLERHGRDFFRQLRCQSSKIVLHSQQSSLLSSLSTFVRSRCIPTTNSLLPFPLFARHVDGVFQWRSIGAICTAQVAAVKRWSGPRHESGRSRHPFGLAA
jgi:hypothetical protein